MAIWRRYTQDASQTIIRQDDQAVKTADLLEGRIFEDLAELSESLIPFNQHAQDVEFGIMWEGCRDERLSEFFA